MRQTNAEVAKECRQMEKNKCNLGSYAENAGSNLANEQQCSARKSLKSIKE